MAWQSRRPLGLGSSVNYVSEAYFAERSVLILKAFDSTRRRPLYLKKLVLSRRSFLRSLVQKSGLDDTVVFGPYGTPQPGCFEFRTWCGCCDTVGSCARVDITGNTTRSEILQTGLVSGVGGLSPQ